MSDFDGGIEEKWWLQRVSDFGGGATPTTGLELRAENLGPKLVIPGNGDVFA